MAKCLCDHLEGIPLGTPMRCPEHGKVWIPCCTGSIYDLGGCTCPKEVKVSLKNKVLALEKMVKDLAAEVRKLSALKAKE